ncbi:lactosylceramide 4-alpha-galactosyltransferase [Vigna umbellata]|uniref:lactosylceramide 4-alpha-galactosyltransferase n=1 Tax=Vigna umbellata TaxID=87088 RepID=UPI001F5FBB2C|nr:lactosylceramide 4-alpha-galactosyltransferase [Vigna umbellata]
MIHAMEQSAKLSLFPVLHLKRSMLSVLFSLPTSFFAFLLLLLLSYNAFTMFSLHLNSPPLRSPPKLLNLSSSANSPLFNNPHSPLLPNSTQSLSLSIQRPKRVKKHKRGLRSLRSEPRSPVSLFHSRLKAFFNTSCRMRFFMTWISPLKSFGERELFSIESLFKSHPDACLVIVSKSLDSHTGSSILKPFVSNGFRVMAIAPDFGYIFKDTHAELWFNRLKEGNVNPGEVSLGQNLSNLLRLVLLYKFGGTYIDLDVIVLKSFSKLRNTIGAQNFDVRTRKWSRLNNAVLIFDKKHPLLFKFIQEFALTFDGNKWGHNGPYLISRVVSRLNGRPGFNFTVLPPSAFYPVDWRGIRGLFRDGIRSKWLVNKMEQIRKESFAVHLWNKHSRELKVVKGSFVDSIISSCCIFCNT